MPVIAVQWLRVNDIDRLADRRRLDTMKDEHRHHLAACNINSVAEAVDAFEENEGLMLCQIQPPSSWFLKLAPFFTVPEGYYALVQRGGRFADYHGSSTWPAGIHFGPPWMRVS